MLKECNTNTKTPPTPPLGRPPRDGTSPVSHYGDDPLYCWLFSGLWHEIDDTPACAAERIQIALAAGAPQEHAETRHLNPGRYSHTIRTSTPAAQTSPSRTTGWDTIWAPTMNSLRRRERPPRPRTYPPSSCRSSTDTHDRVPANQEPPMTPPDLAVTDEAARARLSRAAAYLDALPPSRFTMERFAAPDAHGRTPLPAGVLAAGCGTVGCLAGHIPHIDPEWTRAYIDARCRRGTVQIEFPELANAFIGRPPRDGAGAPSATTAPTRCTAGSSTACGTRSTTPLPAPPSGSGSRSTTASRESSPGCGTSTRPPTQRRAPTRTARGKEPAHEP